MLKHRNTIVISINSGFTSYLKCLDYSETPEEELFDKNKNKFLIFGRKVMYGKWGRKRRGRPIKNEEQEQENDTKK